jgi:hypothetical protein
MGAVSNVFISIAEVMLHAARRSALTCADVALGTHNVLAALIIGGITSWAIASAEARRAAPAVARLRIGALGRVPVPVAVPQLSGGRV